MSTLTRRVAFAFAGILKHSDTHADPAHGRPLPKGHALFPTLRAHMDRQRIWVTDWVRHLREVPSRSFCSSSRIRRDSARVLRISRRRSVISCWSCCSSSRFGCEP